MSNPTYRPDIDGLRSIAVMLVVIFHAGLPYFPGGFVGVDVFFVISGFLITTIIHRETGSREFTYRNFYKRRILRLMPALFAVMLFTTLGALVLLLPSELTSYARSLIATTFSFSNIFFWRENGGYFGGNAQEVPLLHTWSLSVEEQYYFVWPLYMMFCHRFLTHRWLVIFTVLLFFASLALSEWVGRVTFGASYYLLPTRMFELMVGSILAITWSNIPRLSAPLTHGLSLTGLGLVLWSALYLTEADPFPGFNALYPALGTGLLILSGRDSMGIINRILAQRPFVFIGLISYSLYLWHWPIVVYVRHAGITLTAGVSWAIVAVSIVAGWCSWKYVEQRFRHGQFTGFKATFWKLFAMPAAAVVIAGTIMLQTTGLPQRFSADIVAMDQAIATEPRLLRANCHSATRDSDNLPQASCTLGDLSLPTPNAFMIGDSHANHFTGFVDELAKAHGIQVIDYTLDACIPVFDFYWGPNEHFATICKKRNDLARDYIQKNKPQMVILAGNWPGNYARNNYLLDGQQQHSEAEFAQELDKQLTNTLQVVVDAGAIPVILEDGVAARSTPKCPVVKALFKPDLQCNMSAAKAKQRHPFMEQIVAKLQLKFPALIVIDPKQVMCDDEQCFAAIDGVPLYLDSDHLNDSGSRMLAHKFLQKFGDPLALKTPTAADSAEP